RVGVFFCARERARRDGRGQPGGWDPAARGRDASRGRREMDLAPFIQGLIIGLAVAAPVGPMSVLCMRRTLAGGFAAGLLSGFGIASADAIYGSVAAFGITVVSDLLVGQQVLL